LNFETARRRSLSTFPPHTAYTLYTNTRRAYQKLLEISTEVGGELARRRRCEPKAHLQVLEEPEKVKKILEHKDISLTDTTHTRRAIL